MKTLSLKVKPQSRASALLAPAAEGEPWTAHLKSPPVDGKANEELIALVAAYFGCPKSAVRIKSGASGRLKRVQVDGVD